MAERLAADPRVRQGATDREMEVVGPRLGRQAVLEGLAKHVDPELSSGGVDEGRRHAGAAAGGVVVVDLEPPAVAPEAEGLHPDHDPAGGLGLAHERVAVAARGDGERRAAAQGEDVPHGGGDVGHGARVEHGGRQQAAPVAEVARHGAGVVEGEVAAAVEAQRPEGGEDDVGVGHVHGGPAERQQEQQLEAAVLR